MRVKAESALADAKKLVKVIGKSYFDLGNALSIVKSESLYDGLGYVSFSDYVDGELEISLSKARSLINVYDYYGGLGGKLVSFAKSVGWTKASLLVGFVTLDTLDYYKELCGANSVAYVQEIVSGARGRNSSELASRRRIANKQSVLKARCKGKSMPNKISVFRMNDLSAKDACKALSVDTREARASTRLVTVAVPVDEYEKLSDAAKAAGGLSIGEYVLNGFYASERGKKKASA